MKKPQITIDCYFGHMVDIGIDFDDSKGKRTLDEDKVKKIIKRLRLDMASTWAGCWRDDDSPQSEETLGVRRKDYGKCKV